MKGFSYHLSSYHNCMYFCEKQDIQREIGQDFYISGFGWIKTFGNTLQ